MRLDKFDTNVPVEENFAKCYYLMLTVLAYRMVPYHAEKYTVIADFNHMNISDIPFKYFYNVMQRMNLYYC
jgi:hypothetical protein